LILTALAAAPNHLHFDQLGLSPVALKLGFFDIKWYSLAYISGILLGWWYLLKLIAQPGSPMARRHADDLVFYATLGIILGGRLGYAIFYAPAMFLNPVQILKLWDGGMSFHGGMIGTSLAIILFARRHQLNWLRIHDYLACCVPFGLFFGRLANFVNGELWGRPTDVGWAMVFPGDPLGLPRHPSQLYEAALEGALLIVVLLLLFWKTGARFRPGLLVGVFTAGIAAARFTVEFFREPDTQLVWLAEQTGLSMGQWLTVPMIVVGLALVAWALLRPPLASGK